MIRFWALNIPISLLANYYSIAEPQKMYSLILKTKDSLK